MKKSIELTKDEVKMTMWKSAAIYLFLSMIFSWIEVFSVFSLGLEPFKDFYTWIIKLSLTFFFAHQYIGILKKSKEENGEYPTDSILNAIKKDKNRLILLIALQFVSLIGLSFVYENEIAVYIERSEQTVIK